MGCPQNSRAEYARTGKIIIYNELRRYETVVSCPWIAFPGWTCPAGARSGPDACTAAEILRGRNGKTLPRNFGMPEIGDRLSPIRSIGEWPVCSDVSCFTGRAIAWGGRASVRFMGGIVVAERGRLRFLCWDVERSRAVSDEVTVLRGIRQPCL